MITHIKREKAIQLYSFVLKLYPQSHRHAFGSQMLQTFKDHYTDVVELNGKAGADFWFAVLTDEVKGIVREQITSLQGDNYMQNTWVKQGILFGIILGIIHIGYNLINNLAPANITLTNLLNYGLLPVVLIFPTIAGYYTAHKAGNVKAGTYAGLLTGTISIAIGMCTLMIITFAFMNIIRLNTFMIYDFQRSGLKSIDQFIIEDALGAAFFGTLFSLLAGGIFGTIGGYLGVALKKA